MKITHRLAALSLLGIIPSQAQNVYEELTPDHVLEAIREFNRNEITRDSNEVVAVLKPPAAEAAVAPRAEPVEEPPAPAVLVTGTPPADVPQEEESPAAEAPPAEPEGGLDVRVEKLRTSAGTIDPSQVKLHAPFPAKPLFQPPAGWMIDVSDEVPPLGREVELSPGARITLNIRPHLLVPEADGYEVFAIPEPGFNPALGYDQAETVGAVVSKSVRDLDEHAKNLGSVIDRLQQLLVALPTPEPAEPTAPPAKKR